MTKRQYLFGALLVAGLFIASLAFAHAVRADYTGPGNRQKTVPGCTRVYRYYDNGYVCSFPPQAGLNVCGTQCSNHPVCSSAVCDNLRNHRYYYTKDDSQTVTLPNATVSADFQCGLAGNNGWCRGGGTLHVEADEPVSGHVVTVIETDLFGHICQPNTAHATCDYTLPDGQGNVVVWAESSWGDSSGQTSVAWKMDATAPDLTPSVPAPDGNNGWYVSSSVDVDANGSDATSGLTSVQCRVDGGAWQNPPVSVTGDGSHTVDCMAEDNAGNVSTWLQTVKVDATAPDLTPSVPAPDGNNGWYVSSSVSVDANGSDATSGLASVQCRVDGGAWQNPPVSVTGDGSHTVDCMAEDNAGNVSTWSQTMKVDATPPVSAFSAPVEGATVWGVVTLHGESDDPTSGPVAVEVSTDNGATWKPATLEASTGQWTATWDTRPLPDGEYTLMARAKDAAGNEEHTAIVHVTVANAPPQIHLAPQTWYFWQEAQAEITPNPYIPLKSVTVEVLGAPGHVRRWEYDAVQHVNIKWNTRWYSEDGPWAHPGTYRVVVKAVDIYGHGSQAEGRIIVPEPAPTATPTPTATFTPTPTPTPTPTATATARPSSAPQANATVPTVRPTQPPPAATPEPKQGESPPKAALPAALALLAMAATVVLDPRPKVIARLAQRSRTLLLKK